MEYLTDISGMHWFVLALLLLAAEALGAAGFLLGAAGAAFLNALIVWLFPEMALGYQLLIFASMATVATFVYVQWFRKGQNNDNVPPLNQRAASLIGHQFELTTNITNGKGRVQIGDTFWVANVSEDISAGTTVVVKDADNMSLSLEKA